MPYYVAMYFHDRQTRKRYLANKQADTSLQCTYCQAIAPEQLVRTTEHSLLIRNRLPYDMWEHHTVLDHLLIVPKRHVASLGAMTDQEKLDMLALCAEYESQGYNIYARSVDSPRRSVEHQHTHLIRIDAKVASGGVYLKKPYLHITF